MPFRFRLESVLSIKSAFEEKALNELAVLNVALERMKMKLRELEVTKSDFVRKQAEQRNVGRTDLERILAETLYLEVLDAELQTTKQVLRSQRVAVRSKREEALKMSRERQILEKLKEKHRARYEKDADRKEATQADELFLSRRSIEKPD